MEATLKYHNNTLVITIVRTVLSRDETNMMSLLPTKNRRRSSSNVCLMHENASKASERAAAVVMYVVSTKKPFYVCAVFFIKFHFA